MLFLMILAVVWAAVLVPPFIRSRREGRPGSSVMSFRAQLSTLERATPGSSLRPFNEHRPAAHPALAPIDARRRRRDVLVALLGATALSFLLMLVVGGVFTLFFVLSAAALGSYVYALRQRHLRSMERVAKVRVLTPRTAAPAPVLAARAR
jgi:Flp pilus assembly protein TadB